MYHIAQQAADAVGQLDWKHALLAALIPAVAGAAYKVGARAVALVEEKLRTAGHPQAADAFDLLVEHFRAAATDAEKAALAKAAKDAGIDHPAVGEASK